MPRCLSRPCLGIEWRHHPRGSRGRREHVCTAICAPLPEFSLSQALRPLYAECSTMNLPSHIRCVLAHNPPIGERTHRTFRRIFRISAPRLAVAHSQVRGMSSFTLHHILCRRDQRWWHFPRQGKSKEWVISGAAFLSLVTIFTQWRHTSGSSSIPRICCLGSLRQSQSRGYQQRVGTHRRCTTSAMVVALHLEARDRCPRRPHDDDSERAGRAGVVFQGLDTFVTLPNYLSADAGYAFGGVVARRPIFTMREGENDFSPRCTSLLSRASVITA
ncbi:hypothetical protein MSAN_02089800 [Mycena sanguinolenta]|uniref:Uncharacterized protein n=1 Tax=Mycena sanguinolenta TaxID=230812 RepID=A0A8H6XI21_9AGAR|nr:hypothetical protein MSAN_02089800 [Mycena sanguinolenta]